jgi:hypothetical protein
MIFDAGVFLALDNPSKRGVVLALLQKLQSEGIEPATNEAVLAQTWRQPAKQVALNMLLKAVDIYPFGEPKVIGMRCAKTGTNDVVDASLAVLADQLGTCILTTDPRDMAKLEARYQKL